MNLQERRQPSWAYALEQEAKGTYTEKLERICSLNADAIRGKLELQLELARINCTVATKEAENAWATLLSNRDNEHHRRQLIFHTVWKIREFVYNLPQCSHGDPPKHSVYDILSMFLDCAGDNNRYWRLWEELDGLDLNLISSRQDIGRT